LAHRWAAGWAGATPGFWALVRPTPFQLRSGRSRPSCAKTTLRVDIVDDIAADSGVDSGVITERDIRVDHDDFNDVITFHRGGQPMSVIESEDEPRHKALFTPRADPSVFAMLRTYCKFFNSSSQH